MNASATPTSVSAAVIIMSWSRAAVNTCSEVCWYTAYIPTVCAAGPESRSGIGVSAPISDVRSSSIAACCDVINAVSTASPSAAALRCADVVERTRRADLADRHGRHTAGHHGHHRQPHTARAQREQRCDLPFGGIQREVVQRVGADRHDRQPDDRGPARADLVVEPPGDRHQDRHDQRLRQQQQARVERAEALGLLEEQRDVEQRANRPTISTEISSSEFVYGQYLKTRTSSSGCSTSSSMITKRARISAPTQQDDDRDSTSSPSPGPPTAPAAARTARPRW